MNYDVKINKKTIFSSFAWKIMERISSQGISLIIQIILARILLPEDFGSLAIIAAITNYAAVFVQSGLATAIVQKEKLDDLDVSTLLVASLGIATVFYCFLFILSPIIANYYQALELKWELRVLALILFLNAINSIQTAVLSRRMQFKKLFLRSMIAVPISGTVGIIMACLGFGVWSLIAYNMTNVLVVIIVMSLSSGMHIKIKFSWERARCIYAFSSKILITSLISGMHDTVRTMTIGKKYSSEDLAYYDKAYTYSYYAESIINSSISSVLLPVFSRNQSSIAELKNMARKSVRLSAFIMCPLLLGAAAVAKPLVIFLLTEKWAASIPFLMIFCILRLPGCIMSVDKQVYYAIGRSGINLAYEIGLLMVNLSILLITSQHSTLAIAVGAMIVELAGSLAIYYISSKIYNYRLKERLHDLWRPFFNSAIMFVIVGGIQFFNIGVFLSLVVQGITGIFIYLLMAKLTKDDTLIYVLHILGNLKKNKE